jgi:hypothetical protein
LPHPTKMHITGDLNDWADGEALHVMHTRLVRAIAVPFPQGGDHQVKVGERIEIVGGG